MLQCTCEKCGLQIQTPLENAGKKGACPRCKSPITIPDLFANTSSTPEQPASEQQQPRVFPESQAHRSNPKTTRRQANQAKTPQNGGATKKATKPFSVHWEMLLNRFRFDRRFQTKVIVALIASLTVGAIGIFAYSKWEPDSRPTQVQNDNERPAEQVVAAPVEAIGSNTPTSHATQEPSPTSRNDAATPEYAPLSWTPAKEFDIVSLAWAGPHTDVFGQNIIFTPERLISFPGSKYINLSLPACPSQLPYECEIVAKFEACSDLRLHLPVSGKLFVEINFGDISQGNPEKKISVRVDSESVVHVYMDKKPIPKEAIKIINSRSPPPNSDSIPDNSDIRFEIYAVSPHSHIKNWSIRSKSKYSWKTNNPREPLPPLTQIDTTTTLASWSPNASLFDSSIPPKGGIDRRPEVIAHDTRLSLRGLATLAALFVQDGGAKERGIANRIMWLASSIDPTESYVADISNLLSTPRDITSDKFDLEALQFLKENGNVVHFGDERATALFWDITYATLRISPSTLIPNWDSALTPTPSRSNFDQDSSDDSWRALGVTDRYFKEGKITTNAFDETQYIPSAFSQQIIKTASLLLPEDIDRPIETRLASRCIKFTPEGNPEGLKGEISDVRSILSSLPLTGNFKACIELSGNGEFGFEPMNGSTTENRQAFTCTINCDGPPIFLMKRNGGYGEVFRTFKMPFTKDYTQKDWLEKPPVWPCHRLMLERSGDTLLWNIRDEHGRFRNGSVASVEPFYFFLRPSTNDGGNNAIYLTHAHVYRESPDVSIHLKKEENGGITLDLGSRWAALIPQPVGVRHGSLGIPTTNIQRTLSVLYENGKMTRISLPEWATGRSISNHSKGTICATQPFILRRGVTEKFGVFGFWTNTNDLLFHILMRASPGHLLSDKSKTPGRDNFGIGEGSASGGLLPERSDSFLSSSLVGLAGPSTPFVCGLYSLNFKDQPSQVVDLSHDQHPYITVVDWRHSGNERRLLDKFEQTVTDHNNDGIIDGRDAGPFTVAHALQDGSWEPQLSWPPSP